MRLTIFPRLSISLREIAVSTSSLQTARDRWPAAVWPLVILVAAIAIGSRELSAQRAGRPAPEATGLWISDTAVDDARRLLVVVDPATRHAAVYHLDNATGSLVLKSTRDISWDLLVDDFNAQEPRPAALKRLIQAGGPGAGDGGGR
jgi:glycerol-3-phosphate dehydrogenase